MNPDGVRFEIEPDGVRAMEVLLRLCRKEGMAVLLLYAPEYMEMQALTANRAEIFAAARTSCAILRAPCGSAGDTGHIRLAYVNSEC